jgi:hypothetical protein
VTSADLEAALYALTLQFVKIRISASLFPSISFFHLSLRCHPEAKIITIDCSLRSFYLMNMFVSSSAENHPVESQERSRRCLWRSSSTDWIASSDHLYAPLCSNFTCITVSHFILWFFTPSNNFTETPQDFNALFFNCVFFFLTGCS